MDVVRMPTRTYKNGSARCRIRQTNAIPQHMRDSVRELCCLEVPEIDQGKGFATSLLHRICREADAALVILVLWPQPFGEHIAMSRDQLVEWYARAFGFQTIQPKPLLMARMPGGTPRVLSLQPTAAAAYEATQ